GVKSPLDVPVGDNADEDLVLQHKQVPYAAAPEHWDRDLDGVLGRDRDQLPRHQILHVHGLYRGSSQAVKLIGTPFPAVRFSLPEGRDRLRRGGVDGPERDEPRDGQDLLLVLRQVAQGQAAAALPYRLPQTEEESQRRRAEVVRAAEV